MISKLLRSLVLGWFVMTYTNQAVAGPFVLLSECREMAEIMSQRYSGISRVCQFRD